jgi:hypothetical protein
LLCRCGAVRVVVARLCANALLCPAYCQEEIRFLEERTQALKQANASKGAADVVCVFACACLCMCACVAWGLVALVGGSAR